MLRNYLWSCRNLQPLVGPGHVRIFNIVLRILTWPGRIDEILRRNAKGFQEGSSCTTISWIAGAFLRRPGDVLAHPFLLQLEDEDEPLPFNPEQSGFL